MSQNQKDAWNPKQYDKFKKQRSEPFYDLMGLLQPVVDAEVVDLGCGTGELTSELHQFLKAKNTLGIDSSVEMLKNARSIATDNLIFEDGNISGWTRPAKYDIVFSNAALQWCGEHEMIFKRLKESLKNNGQLAVQMPMNHDYPTHLLADEMASEPKWAAALSGEKRKTNMLTAEEYASLLFHLGFKEQKVQLRVYGHLLDSRDGVIEWVKGTLLTYFEERLNPDQFKDFVTEFRQRLFQRIPDNKPFFYPFKRVLIWARL